MRRAVRAAVALGAAAALGFQGKMCIHPDQILPIVRGMQPSAEEIGDATAILLAAQAADWGPVGHRGKLHDRASFRYFWQVIERARRTDQRARYVRPSMPTKSTSAWPDAGSSG